MNITFDVVLKELVEVGTMYRTLGLVILEVTDCIKGVCSGWYPPKLEVPISTSSFFLRGGRKREIAHAVLEFEMILGLRSVRTLQGEVLSTAVCR